MKKSRDKNLFDFKRIYETHISSLIAFANRFVPPEAAKDIVQDVFLAFLEQNTDYDTDTIHSYLFTSVKNKCLNFIKQQTNKEKYVENAKFQNSLLELNYYDSIEKLIIDHESKAYIHTQINLLPEKGRLIFKLAYLEDKKSAEIAQDLGISQRTVEHHLYLSLKQLRSKLIEKGKNKEKKDDFD